MTEHVIRAADDIVWDSTQDAYGAARALMVATMRYRIMPTVVNLTRHWARDKAAEHSARRRPAPDSDSATDGTP